MHQGKIPIKTGLFSVWWNITPLSGHLGFLLTALEKLPIALLNLYNLTIYAGFHLSGAWFECSQKVPVYYFMTLNSFNLQHNGLYPEFRGQESIYHPHYCKYRSSWESRWGRSNWTDQSEWMTYFPLVTVLPWLWFSVGGPWDPFEGVAGHHTVLALMNMIPKINPVVSNRNP